MTSSSELTVMKLISYLTVQTSMACHTQLEEKPTFHQEGRSGTSLTHSTIVYLRTAITASPTQVCAAKYTNNKSWFVWVYCIPHQDY